MADAALPKTCYPERIETVNKDRFLTVRWNNLLTLALGLPTLAYVVVAFATSIWPTQGGLIGLATIGVFY